MKNMMNTNGIPWEWWTMIEQMMERTDEERWKWFWWFKKPCDFRLRSFQAHPDSISAVQGCSHRSSNGSQDPTGKVMDHPIISQPEFSSEPSFPKKGGTPQKMHGFQHWSWSNDVEWLDELGLQPNWRYNLCFCPGLNNIVSHRLCANTRLMLWTIRWM